MDENWQDYLKKLGKATKQKQHEEKNEKLQKKVDSIKEINFKTAVGEVSPLKNNNYQIFTKPKPKAVPIKQSNNNNINQEVFVSTVDDSSFENEPPAQYSSGGQGKNDIKRLLSGQYRIISTLDLHGYNQEEAQKVLNEFIDYVQERGVCGKIIHGSGLNSPGFVSKLKILVRRWLINHPEVLAYTEPSPRDDGSVLVLLKKRHVSHYQDEKYQ